MVAAGFAPNCIVFTTLLKGHAAAGSVSTAEALFDQMGEQTPPVAPDTRAVNTFMRACIRVGDLAAAERVLTRCGKEEWPACQPDGATHRWLVRLLSQNLRASDIKHRLAALRTAAKQQKKSMAAHTLAAHADTGAVVRLRGLPYSAGDKAIRGFLSGLAGSIEEVHLVTVPSTRGLGPKPSGDAFVRLDSAVAAGSAINEYHRRLLGERYVEVQEATFSELRASKHGLGAVKLCSFWAAGKCDRGAACQYYHDPAIMQREAAQQLAEQLDHDVAMNLDAAHAAALLGKWEACNTALGRAAKAEAAGEIATAQVVEGAADAKAALFQQMRRQELGLERLRIAAFAERVAADGGEATDLPDCLGRVFIFSSEIQIDDDAAGGGGSEEEDGEGAAQDADDVRKRLLAALRATMGLEEVVDRGLTTVKAAKKRLKVCVGDDAKLRWRRVFNHPKGEAKPLKLEICSGNGDWAAAQAGAEKGEADWAALELRHDRVYSIFSRLAFEGLSNFAAIGGDARRVVHGNIAAGSVAHAFINFPEPPHHRSPPPPSSAPSPSRR